MELFFVEENCDVSKEIFRKAITDRVRYDKTDVIDYLQKGKVIAHCGKECRDVFTNEFIAMSFAVHTDGEYYWRSDLPYYVKKYNIDFPDGFLNKIE